MNPGKISHELVNLFFQHPLLQKQVKGKLEKEVKVQKIRNHHSQIMRYGFNPLYTNGLSILLDTKSKG